MAYSMTGYANRSISIGQVVVQIDVRSVNHRFFEFSIKYPDDFRSVEQYIRDKVYHKLSRGKIDLRIIVKKNSAALKFMVNEELLKVYLAIIKNIEQSCDNKLSPISAIDIMNISGIVSTSDQSSTSTEEIQEKVLSEIDLLLDDLVTNQLVEGNKLVTVVEQHVCQIETIVNAVVSTISDIVNKHKQQLYGKLLDVVDMPSLNEQRFQQEFVYFCQKIDINEEIDRLVSHVNQLKLLLKEDRSIGKEIDFFAQEMQRETNTLGSKSVSTKTTQMALNIKTIIEKIREQAQNIR